MDYFYHHTTQEKSTDLDGNNKQGYILLPEKKESEMKNNQGSKQNLKMILAFWKTFVVIFTPFLLAPILTHVGTQEAKCGYVILLMAVYWVTEALPLPVTALLPVVLLPLLKVMTTDDVCIKYLKESNVMFMGSMMVAIAVEHCGLHQRIALKFLLLVGTSPRLLMLGFMLPTMFLSMWISNTATTAMMVPIVNAVLQELTSKKKESQKKEEEVIGDKIENLSSIENSEKENERKIKVMIYLSIAYAANTGGTGTLTGTGPNLVLKGIIGTLFGSSTPLNFASWIV